METPKEADPTGEDSDRQKSQKFKKNDFTIFMEEMGDGFHKFYVKSGAVFKKFIKSIGNALRYFRFKFLNIFRDKSIEEEQYEMSKELYHQNKKLKKKLQEIENSVEKTQDLASQIKDDTKKIMVDIETVAFILEYQMDRIDDLEDYMKENLGNDWVQIKNQWSMYKDGEITRIDFAKVALRKLGKNFIGLFVNTVS